MLTPTPQQQTTTGTVQPGPGKKQAHGPPGLPGASALPTLVPTQNPSPTTFQPGQAQPESSSQGVPGCVCVGGEGVPRPADRSRPLGKARFGHPKTMGRWMGAGASAKQGRPPPRTRIPLAEEMGYGRRGGLGTRTRARGFRGTRETGGVAAPRWGPWLSQTRFPWCRSPRPPPGRP